MTRVWRAMRELWREYRDFGVQEIKQIEAQAKRIENARMELRKSEIELKNAEKKVLDAVKVAASQSLDAQTRALESLNHSMEQRHRDVQLPSEMAIPPHVSPADLPPDDPQLRVFEALQAQFESRVASPTGLVARVMRQKLEDARRSGGTVGPATLGADVSNALNELEHASQRALDSADAIEREYNLRPAAAKQETK